MAVEFSGLLDSIEGWAEAVADGARANIEQTKKDDAPVGETHELVDSIHADGPFGGGGSFTVELHADAEHASYTNEADGPEGWYENPMLRFEIGGEVFYRHSVNWVGSPKVQANIGWFDRDLDVEWSDAVQAAADEITWSS